MNKQTQDQFSLTEAKRRFEAALRGARIAGPKHKIAIPKGAKAQQGKRKKAK